MTAVRRLRARLARGADAKERERGGVTLELAIIAPVLIAFLLLMVAMGRVAGAQSAIDAAAHSAARAGSLQRSLPEARQQALAAAQVTLADRGLSCVDLTVQTNGNFSPVGLDAPTTMVSVNVTCVAVVSDLGGVEWLNIGPNRTLQSQALSPIDRYRRSP